MSLPYREHFSGSCGRWSRQDDSQLKAGCANGEYQVLMRSARNVQVFTIPIDAAGVRVDADVRVASGPLPKKYGLGCFLGDRSGYWAVLSPGAGFETASYVQTGPGIAQISPSAREGHAISVRRTYHLRADCRWYGVVMWVDGHSVGGPPAIQDVTHRSAAEAAGLKPSHLKHVGFVVFPSTSGSDVRFDNLRVGKPPSPATYSRPYQKFALVNTWEEQEDFSDNQQAIDGAVGFVQAGCLNCHTYLGAGTQRLGAPDLSAEGRKHRGRAWQIAHLRNPASVVTGSRMPSFRSLAIGDLQVLAAFLEASKGRVAH